MRQHLSPFKAHLLVCVCLSFSLFLLGCQTTPNPPSVAQPEPNLLALFPSETPGPIVVDFVTRLPEVAPTVESTATPLPTHTSIPSIIETPIPTPTLAPTITPTPCAESGRIEQGTFISRVQGPVRNYRVYLPPCFGQDGKVYPTLYMLHGNIRGDEEWDVIGIDDSAEILINSNQIAPMLIVMPDGRTISDISSGGDWSYEDILLNELLPHIETTYCAGTDSDLRAIGGLSRGGYWSFEVAFRNPDLFESAASHSGSFLDSGNDVTINPLYTVTRNDLGDLRIAMDYGGDDWSYNTGLPIHESLVEAGIAHKWDAYETGGHDDLYWQEHVTGYLEWYAENWSLDRSSYSSCATQ